MEKRFGITNKFLIYGRLSGFGIGFTINRYFIDVQLGFWYIGFEY